jgi:ATP-dependent Zn protease
MVIEDVDLIARERGLMQHPGQESLLNKLLNEMDGLREDADVLFILTTNRPDQLEPALASRPGRIDQAIEEMVFAGGALNLKLLGGSSALGQSLEP